MRIAVPIFALAALALPSSGQAQGLFAFEGAPPAEGGFDRPYSSAFSPPVQATLQEIPALDGPYGNTLPSLKELGTLETEAQKRPVHGLTERNADQNAAQAASVPPETSLRPRMNPLREPVREKRKVGRFLRRFVVNPLRQKPQASKQSNHSNSQPGNPVP